MAQDRIILLDVLPEAAPDLSPLSAPTADDLATIWLGSTYVNDEQLSYLARLTELLWIDVQNTGDITDTGIASLSRLRSVQAGVRSPEDSSISCASAVPLEDIWADRFGGSEGQWKQHAPVSHQSCSLARGGRARRCSE